MAFGTCTMVTSAGGRPSAPTYYLDITLVGDGAYPTGGTAGFAALVQDVAEGHGLAFLDVPFHQSPHRHRVGELRHIDNFSHRS